ncbi:phosphoribosylglycinamide formyltransferase [Salinispirillum sp. LH 10-3-1]|uniref:Phosphoribosylglycinamide formyltransferase n=1 Tax=Salinispirillum sp. LH 10-3-1 TaxID=2952525 RepID=A0AB38YCH2_9GAMM
MNSDLESSTNGNSGCRVVVLISGGGTNLQALIDAAQQDTLAGAQLVGVLSNRPNAGGLARAAQVSIPSITLNHQDYASREAFDAAMLHNIDAWQPDLVVLAGFMRILTPEFVAHYEGRMINIHPSLLPKYPGLHTHARAIEAGDREHGATVHFVTTELDGGPAIVQASVPVHSDDTEAILAQRVQTVEHQIYPAAVAWFAQGLLTMRSGRAYMRGKLIGSTGLNWNESAP